jgi:hypothetical protein
MGYSSRDQPLLEREQTVNFQARRTAAVTSKTTVDNTATSASN